VFNSSLHIMSHFTNSRVGVDIMSLRSSLERKSLDRFSPNKCQTISLNPDESLRYKLADFKRSFVKPITPNIIENPLLTILLDMATTVKRK